MRRWLEALPDEVVRTRPVLSVGYAGALMVSGETRGVEARLHDAERGLAERDGRGEASQQVVVVDEVAFRRLPGAIALYRAGLAIGLLGAPLLLASDIAILFGLYDRMAPIAALMALPIAVWEFSLGVYLLVKGFRPTAVATLKPAF